MELLVISVWWHHWKSIASVVSFLISALWFNWQIFITCLILQNFKLIRTKLSLTLSNNKVNEYYGWQHPTPICYRWWVSFLKINVSTLFAFKKNRLLSLLFIAKNSNSLKTNKTIKQIKMWSWMRTWLAYGYNWLQPITILHCFKF